MSTEQKIIYTETDEAPRLATFSFLPIIKAFSDAAGVQVETRDISLAGRILASFPEWLSAEQQITDDLAELGALTHDPAANIIKLPNISASNPQMLSAIKELQDQGYALPEYPEEPQNAEEQDIKGRYDRIKGSAVNPVLREGNSDRRATKAVKEYAKKNPHSMGTWSADSKSHVAHMLDGDFFASEISATMPQADELAIVLHTQDGTETLASGIAVIRVGAATEIEMIHQREPDALFLSAVRGDGMQGLKQWLREQFFDPGAESPQLTTGDSPPWPS